MKKVLLFSLLSVASAAFYSCSDDDSDENSGDNISKATLLTGGSSKKWQITPLVEQEDCEGYEKVTQDNYFTFYADGKFEYDNGDVTEMEGCGDSDIVSIIGKWRFNDAQDSIFTYDEKKKDDPSVVFDEGLFGHKLESLTSTKMEVSYTYYDEDEESDVTENSTFISE